MKTTEDSGVNAHYHDKPYTGAPALTGTISITFPKTATLDDLSVAIVKAYLERYDHNATRVAKMLGIARQSIYNWGLR